MIVRLSVMVCDSCHTESDFSAELTRDLETKAEQHGWLVTDALNVCPTCPHSIEEANR